MPLLVADTHKFHEHYQELTGVQKQMVHHNAHEAHLRSYANRERLGLSRHNYYEAL